MKYKHLEYPITGLKISVGLLFIVMFLGLFTAEVYGQIGIGTTSPDTNTVLEIHSESKGILIPRMAKKQLKKINSPPIGLMVFVTNAIENGQWFPINGQWFWYIYETRGRLWIYDGVDWGEVIVIVQH